MNIKRISILLMIAAAIAALVTTAFTAQAADEDRKIVGTWVCEVAGDPAFQALQTFHEDGTFTETSSLLGQGQEGPAHGVWSRDGRQYRLTFQLFTFDPDTGESTGMIRVRVTMQLDGPDRLIGTFGSADLIDLDGNITELGGGPNPDTCTRLKVLPAE